MANRKKTKGGVSFILPVYNGEQHLENAVRQISACMGKNGIADFEIVIAEDGSRDRSAEIARNLAGKNPRITAVSYKQRMGKGRAIENASKKCKFQKIIFTDVDLSGGTDKFMQMMASLDNAELAIGNRYSARSGSQRDALRQILSFGYRFMVNLLFLRWNDDYQCGLKGFRKSAMLRLIPLIADKKWVWDTELILEASRQGMKISEIPVHWVEKPSTALKVGPTMMEMFVDLARYRWRTLHG